MCLDGISDVDVGYPFKVKNLRMLVQCKYLNLENKGKCQVAFMDLIDHF